MKTRKQTIQGKEYFIISQHFNKQDKSIEGFVLIGNYDRTFTIYRKENPVFFRGFCLPDEIEGPESEELNQIDFNDILVEFYKEVL
jgi:hypothetical protein